MFSLFSVVFERGVVMMFEVKRVAVCKLLGNEKRLESL